MTKTNIIPMGEESMKAFDKVLAEHLQVAPFLSVSEESKAILKYWGIDQKIMNKITLPLDEDWKADLIFGDEDATNEDE